MVYQAVPVDLNDYFSSSGSNSILPSFRSAGTTNSSGSLNGDDRKKLYILGSLVIILILILVIVLPVIHHHNHGHTLDEKDNFSEIPHVMETNHYGHIFKEGIKDEKKLELVETVDVEPDEHEMTLDFMDKEAKGMSIEKFVNEDEVDELDLDDSFDDDAVDNVIDCDGIDGIQLGRAHDRASLDNEIFYEGDDSLLWKVSGAEPDEDEEFIEFEDRFDAGGSLYVPSIYGVDDSVDDSLDYMKPEMGIIHDDDGT